MTLAYKPDLQGYLGRKGVSFEIRPHRTTYTATAEARALHMRPKEVLKTVALRTSSGFLVAVIPASNRVDVRTIARHLDDPTARIASEDEIATKFPGFEVGALPPLPGLLHVPAYVDPRIFEPERVAFTDGRHAEAVLADPKELFWGEKAFVYPICVDDAVSQVA